jgi:hypothetical protein
MGAGLGAGRPWFWWLQNILFWLGVWRSALPDPGARLAGGVVAQVGRVSLRVVCTGAGTGQISDAGCCGGHHVAAAVILLTVLEAGELPAGTAP